MLLTSQELGETRHLCIFIENFYEKLPFRVKVLYHNRSYAYYLQEWICMKSKTLTPESNLVAASIEILQPEIEELYEMDVDEIVLDLCKVELVDSTGIGFVIRIQNTLEKKEGQLVLVNVHDDIKKMLQIMRLDKHITIR